jgi:hypothetical protein
VRAAAALTSVAALTGVLLVGLPGAGAATIDVTTTTDGGAGSLRAAITEANATPGADVIQLPAGTYTLSIAGAGEDGNATGDLDIEGDLTIIGAGAATTVIDAAGIDRVLEVSSGNVTLQHVTIAGGDSGPGTTTGGGIRKRGAGDLAVLDSIVRDNHSWGGGGIVVFGGALSVLRSEIVDNVVESEPGDGSVGGGISQPNANGSMTVSESLIAGNSSVGGNAGGLYSNSPTIAISNSTFTGNSQYTRTVLFENWTAVAGTATLQFVTIAGNTSVGSTGGIHSNVGPNSTLDLTLEGVLLQDNTTQGAPLNCEVANNGTFTSLGSNLSDDATCNLTDPTDLASNTLTDLGPLADNEGPTRTVALVDGSSAVDVATCNGAIPTDQRGAIRPVGTVCDIGAFELGAEVPPSTTTTTTTESTTTTTEATTTTTAPTTTTAGPTPTTPTSVDSATMAATTFASNTTGTLPVTGAPETVRLLLLAIGLLAAGFTILLSSRRRLGQKLVHDLKGQDHRR